MSATVEIVKRIKSVTDFIKKKEEKNKENMSANKALVDKLLAMQDAYNKKTLYATPNYGQVIDIGDKPTVQSDAELKEQASQYVSDLVQANKDKVEGKAYEKINKLEDSQLKAYRKFTDSQDKTVDRFDQQKDYITSKVIKQGIVHSSIREDWQEQNARDYLNNMAMIRRDYDEQIAQINSQINIINTAKTQALAEYDLTLSASYEKKLQQLRGEQVKTIEKLASYNMEYEKELERLQQQQFEQEIREGYSGEKAQEMDNRYQQALEFYKSLDTNNALKLIEESKSELKQALGWYYPKLVEEVRKKK